MKVSIVVPILNERRLLPEALERLKASLSQAPELEWEVVLTDAGSTDGSRDCASPFLQSPSWKWVQGELPSPSVGRTLELGVQKASGEAILILPCDVGIDGQALRLLAKALLEQPASCGGFRKRYDAGPWVMRVYAGVQNAVRTRLLRHLVWTNAIFAHRTILASHPIPTVGFLEDVIWSDRLRKLPEWRLIPASVSVSSRRYYPRRVLRRILLNLSILACWRLRLISSPLRLRGLYRALG